MSLTYVSVRDQEMPIHVFYNVIDLALVNSCFFSEDCKSSMSHRCLNNARLVNLRAQTAARILGVGSRSHTTRS